MASRSPLLRIHDMLESIRGIEKAIAGKTLRDYERSWVLRSALERGIEVISEASRHLGRELKSQHKDVRWGHRRYRQYPAPRVSTGRQPDHLECGERRSADTQESAAGHQGFVEGTRQRLGNRRHREGRKRRSNSFLRRGCGLDCLAVPSQ